MNIEAYLNNINANLRQNPQKTQPFINKMKTLKILKNIVLAFGAKNICCSAG